MQPTESTPSTPTVIQPAEQTPSTSTLLGVGFEG
jgi:hypothetical protein